MALPAPLQSIYCRLRNLKRTRARTQVLRHLKPANSIYKQTTAAAKCHNVSTAPSAVDHVGGILKPVCRHVILPTLLVRGFAAAVQPLPP